MKVPLGFQFAGLHSGIKPNRKDLALIVSEAPCSAAGVFTKNLAKAAPVLDSEARLPSTGIRAVLVNSGNANALTGPAGLADVLAVREAAAAALHISADAILTASTGVIGQRLPVHKIVHTLPLAVASLRPEAEQAAEAILTLDTRVKLATRTLVLPAPDGTPRDVTLSILCKGSGMIAPELATVLAFLVTDAAVSPGHLQAVLQAAMPRSFNSLTIDGDMSTNDCVFALANGLSLCAPLLPGTAAHTTFSAAVFDLCREMAKEIAADGEGATKLLEVMICNAPSDPIAQDLAKAVAGSTLVKTALFGADPNWGRILAAVGARAGTKGYPLDPAAARVKVQGVIVYDGAPAGVDAASLKARLRVTEVRIEVALGASSGTSTATAWGCDLSYDTVKINADYASLIIPTESGGVAKDDRLANYSPNFKVSLLVEALSYIQRFTGTRCVIKYGGAAMVKDSLKKSFCDDVSLLRSIGLKPVVVHGGGPELTRTLEKLGGQAEFVDGIRFTNMSDLKVKEMVLTGSINSELVTLLNQENGHAVGMSGKDGGLLRARKQKTEGRDLGQVGEITRINRDFLELLLNQGYVPVISPIGLGEDGQTWDLNADTVAAKVATAIGAEKLIYLSDVAGILRAGELISELTATGLQDLLDDGTVQGGMKSKALSIIECLRGGVQRVHLIDGRVPHSIIGELFTDKGVGSLVTA